MVSVCMAVKDGSRFLEDQISSILPQLRGEDDLIISDDHSTDNTIALIENLNDKRIKLLINPGEGLVSNFENALLAARGQYIFLADQDDIWHPDKIKIMLNYLQRYDLVICDCELVNEHLQPYKESFFQLNDSKGGMLRNLFRNSYMGCCMAFNRKLLWKALPFPQKIYVHDAWIGLIGETYFSKIFIREKLVSHRKHSNNASSTATKSHYPFADKLVSRLQLIKGLINVHYGR